jgi:hypothetical protein
VQKVLNQHYVPQTYLKRFTYDGEHLWALDKVAGKSFRAHVRNVASQRLFYDMPEDLEAQAGGPQAVERLFQLVEDGGRCGRSPSSTSPTPSSRGWDPSSAADCPNQTSAT